MMMRPEHTIPAAGGTPLPAPARIAGEGPRTLRAETAPIVATSAILYEMGDLD